MFLEKVKITSAKAAKILNNKNLESPEFIIFDFLHDFEDAIPGENNRWLRQKNGEPQEYRVWIHFCFGEFNQRKTNREANPKIMVNVVL